jgi:hypothetical protein
MSSGSQIVTYIVAETTPGETPTDPTWDTLRLTGNGMSPDVGTEQSSEIRADRMSGGNVITSLDYAGDLGYEFSAASFDQLIEAAFYGNWEADTPSVGSDTLEIGSTRHTFTLVRGYKDIDVWTTFRGVHINTMSIEIPEEGIITGTFGCMALSYEGETTNPTDGDTINPSTSTIVMGSATAVGDIEFDDNPLAAGACISSMSLSIDNSIQTQRCLGKAGPGALIAMQANVTGTIQVAWSQDTFALWGKTLTRQSVKVSFPLQDSSGNTYLFELPQIEVDGQLPDGGNNDLVEAELNIAAKLTPIKVTRTLAP